MSNVRKMTKVIGRSGSRGTIFTVDYINNFGTKIRVNGRLGVRYDFIEDILTKNYLDKNFIHVYDMKKRSYVNVNLGTITRVAAKGFVFEYSKYSSGERFINAIKKLFR